jgi:hypothetical protein
MRDCLTCCGGRKQDERGGHEGAGHVSRGASPMGYALEGRWCFYHDWDRRNAYVSLNWSVCFECSDDLA